VPLYSLDETVTVASYDYITANPDLRRFREPDVKQRQGSFLEKMRQAVSAGGVDLPAGENEQNEGGNLDAKADTVSISDSSPSHKVPLCGVFLLHPTIIGLCLGSVARLAEKLTLSSTLDATLSSTLDAT
jgi:hypothetical protein